MRGDGDWDGAGGRSDADGPEWDSRAGRQGEAKAAAESGAGYAAADAAGCEAGAVGVRDALVLCGVDVYEGRAAALEDAGVQVERIAERKGRLDLGVVLDVLGERKILSLMLECGSELNGAFLTQGLVDRVVLFKSEKELGAGGVPFAAGVSVGDVEGRMGGVMRTGFGADVRVSGALRDVWEGIG